MTVQVVFFRPQGIGSAHAPGVAGIRVREAVTIPGTTTATVRDGESVVVYNGETGAVFAAHGLTPNATATAATAATTAGFPIPAGQNSPPIQAATGAKINVKAVP